MSAPKGIDVHAWQKRIREDPELTATVRVVAFVMSTYGNYGNGKSVRVSRQTVAAGSNLSVRTVGMAQGVLLASGWLELVEDNSRSGNHKVNVYALSLPEWGKHVPPLARQVEEPHDVSGGTSRQEWGNLATEVGEPVAHYLAIDLAMDPHKDPEAQPVPSVWDRLDDDPMTVEGADPPDRDDQYRWVPDAIDLSEAPSFEDPPSRPRFGPSSQAMTPARQIARKWADA